MKKIFGNSSDIGKLMILIGLLLLVPLIILPFYSDEIGYALSFILPAISSIIAGFIICALFKQKEDMRIWNYNMQNGNLTVFFAWLYAFLLGSLPFVISKQLNFVGALFESVSGWTTTGLSVMDVSITPAIFLFYRSFMQYCGGIGFVLMMVVIIQNKQSSNLFNAEGHNDQIMPSLGKTARSILMTYIVLFIIGTLLYIAAGMPVFDSLIHSMSALSTGGFSTKVNSIGEYNNIAIEAVTIALMLIGTTKFAVLLLFIKRKFRQAFRVSELKFMFAVLCIFIPLVTLSLVYGVYINVGEAIRQSIFNVVSALSTTGYSTVSYANWTGFGLGMIIILMLIGGGMGSTAGGLKLTRVYLLFRTGGENIKKRLSPSGKVSAPYYYKAQGKTDIDGNLLFDNLGFAIIYLFIFIIGSLLLTVTESCSLTNAMFEFASSLGTVGLSIGITNPATNAGTLIVEMFGMILGRLEIFVVIIGIFSAFSKIRKKISRNKIQF